MTLLDRLLGCGVAVAATVGIAAASSVRMTPHASADSVLRLTWTARPERVEDCRAQSEEALSKLPPHMRQAVICEGTTASYRLVVRRERAVVLDEIVRGGGLRHDRPLYVFRDIAMPAGDSSIRVQFDRVEVTTSGTGGTRVPSAGVLPGTRDAAKRGEAMDADRRRREGDERMRTRGEAIPPSLSIERRFHFLPREVLLVTYDSERRELLALERRSP
jgi:hypothetical protein